jgi:hypothetical protein
MALPDWQENVERQLALDDAPPVLSRDLLKRYSRAANVNLPVPSSSLTYWKNLMLRKGRLKIVQRGLFLNNFGTSCGTLADACFWYHPDSVVSLNTVLGASGVLNNPSNAVTAVVPINRGAHPPSRLGRKHTKAGDVHFYGIPRRIIESGEPDDRLDTSDLYAHLRATPEKALLDWLYLGLSPRSRRTVPICSDIDLEMLDKRRLNRLAKAAQLDHELQGWMTA